MTSNRAATSGRTRKSLHVLGKVLISVGVGVMQFVGWTLWGTGIYAARQQDLLGREFARLPTFSADASSTGEAVDAPTSFPPEPGSPVFRIRIPAIDLDQIVVEGVGFDELRKGPGHYPSCRSGFEEPLCTEFDEAWPGEHRRVIVSGHRTTYGAPFWDLDKLRRGDQVVTETKWGTFIYIVTAQRKVEPDARDIVIPGSTGELVLTTCDPKFSAAHAADRLRPTERWQLTERLTCHLIYGL